MSFIDRLIDGAVEIGVAKAQNPRVVQTAEQRQVSTGQQVNARVGGTVGSSVDGSSMMSVLKDKRVLAGIFIVGVGFVAMQAFR